jgi:hypothetical protein
VIDCLCLDKTRLEQKTENREQRERPKY